MKVQKWNCKVCGVSFPQKYLEKFKYICPWCQNKETPKQEIVVEKVKPISITTDDSINWLKLYTASYLHNKLNLNYNSIKKEIPCIKYKDKYILKEDIINLFKSSLQ